MASVETHAMDLDKDNLPLNTRLSALSSYKISGLPPDAYYVPDFLTPREAADIYDHLASLPEIQWIYLSHRRLQPQPAPLTATGHLLTTKSLPAHLREPIIPRLIELCRENEEIWTNSPHGQPNHCLVNEYKPGEGISKHQDGAAYWGVVATVSLGGDIVLDVERKSVNIDQEHISGSDEASREDIEPAPRRIFQEHGSLLITMNGMYTDHLHGISSLKVDEDVTASTVVNWDLLRQETRSRLEANGGINERTTRISLTYRDVIKVKDASKMFGGRKH